LLIPRASQDEVAKRVCDGPLAAVRVHDAYSIINLLGECQTLVKPGAGRRIVFLLARDQTEKDKGPGEVRAADRPSYYDGFLQPRASCCQVSGEELDKAQRSWPAGPTQGTDATLLGAPSARATELGLP
jgi:hypothetical protein